MSNCRQICWLLCDITHETDYDRTVSICQLLQLPVRSKIRLLDDTYDSGDDSNSDDEGDDNQASSSGQAVADARSNGAPRPAAADTSVQSQQNDSQVRDIILS